ncbi:MAG TPA: ParB/RepB/Spo0J family partition protein [Candidatus Binataceae bacterium]|nr:ParB/RepB/Spo0J family partition protein [Candidatus Binataceae bacterium]
MIRRGLGRGLDALIESTDGAVAADSSPARPGLDGSGALSVELDQVTPSPLQPRRHFDSARLQELAQAIRSQGIIEPLVVRPAPSSDGAAARYELVAGERRWRAARIAGLSVVPVVVRELDDHAALEMSLVENLIREDLNPVDEAHGFERLARSFGMSHDQVAARIGKSRPYVSNAIRLLDLPPAVLEMIERGELSAGQARPLLAMGSAEAQTVAARRIVEGRISARGAEELAGAARRARGGSLRGVAAIDPKVDPNLAALAEGMQRGLKRKVRIVRARGRKPGRIEIEFYGVDDLTALAATLGAAARAHSAVS